MKKRLDFSCSHFTLTQFLEGGLEKMVLILVFILWLLFSVFFLHAEIATLKRHTFTHHHYHKDIIQPRELKRVGIGIGIEIEIEIGALPRENCLLR